MTTTEDLWNDRLASIMPENFENNRSTEFTAMAGILENMINRIGRTIIAGQPNAYNPFSDWTRAIMDYGDTIQQYTIPYIKGRKPDYMPDNPNPFAIAKTDPKVQYWQINDGTQYKNTIFDDQLKKAFTNEQTFGSFTGELISTIYKSAGIDMFLKWKKYLSTQDIATDDATVTIDTSDADNFGYDLWVLIKDWVTNKLRYPSEAYNKMEFLTSSPAVDIIITTEARNKMDNALRGIYNVNKVEVPGVSFKEIDSFDNDDTIALILTKGMASYTPRTPIAGALYNPENYYTNYWYKEEGLFSIDLGQNAVKITSE